MSLAFMLSNLTEESRKLYVRVHDADAREPSAREFWSEILDAWIQYQGRAIRRIAEHPPVANLTSEHNRRRVDILLKAFVEKTKERFTLLFVEVKGAHVSASEYETVELQAQDACEAYLNENESVTTTVYAMCAVGTRVRMFRYIKDVDFGWQSLWGNTDEYDQYQYYDAADPVGSLEIWRGLITMMQAPPATLADKSYLQPRVPTQQSFVLQSQTQTVPSSSSMPRQNWHGYVLEYREGHAPQGYVLHCKVDGRSQQFTASFVSRGSPPKIYHARIGDWLQTTLGTDDHLWVTGSTGQKRLEK